MGWAGLKILILGVLGLYCILALDWHRTISNRRGSVPARVGGQNPWFKNAAAERFASAACSLPGETVVCRPFIYDINLFLTLLHHFVLY